MAVHGRVASMFERRVHLDHLGVDTICNSRLAHDWRWMVVGKDSSGYRMVDPRLETPVRAPDKVELFFALLVSKISAGRFSFIYMS